MRALSIDRNAAAGYGSTSSSSACVRAHYSSRESVALAYEGFSYWQDWGNYLGTEDERGHAPYVNCGTVLLTSDDGQYRTSLQFYDAVGLPYEDWDRETLAERVPARRRPGRGRLSHRGRRPGHLLPARDRRHDAGRQ